MDVGYFFEETAFGLSLNTKLFSADFERYLPSKPVNSHCLHQRGKTNTATVLPCLQ